jgi:PAS domain S-box-containing protein
MGRPLRVPVLSRISAQIAGIAAMLLGGAALLGWWLNNASLKSIVPGSSPMMPNIAAGLLLCGGGLAFLSLIRAAKPARICAAVAGIFVFIFGGLTLGEHFFGWNPGIDHGLIPQRANGTSQIRMGPATALCFVLTGILFFAQSQLASRRWSLPLAVGLSTALAFIGALALAGFLLEMLFGPGWNLLGMNLSGVTLAVGFLLLGSGVLALLQSERHLVWFLDPFTTAGFVSGILLVVVAAAFAFTHTRRMLETTAGLTHQHEVLAKIHGVDANMSELSSWQRVYIITGDEQYLKPRELIKAEARNGSVSARKLTSDNPSQQRRLDVLEPLIEQRIDWEERMINVRRTEGFPAASQMLATGVGLRISAEIHAVLRELEQEEYRLLAKHRKQAGVASMTAFSILPMGVFLSLAILSLALAFLNSGVTEQKRAQSALRESEAQLQTIVENLDQGVVVADLNGRLLHWNRAAQELHGYSSSEQDRRLFPELVDTFELSTLQGAVLPATEWPLARILRDKKLRDFELRVRRIGTDWERINSYGGTLVQGENSQPLLAITTVTDITERKRAEEALRENEQQFRTMVDAIAQLAWMARPDGFIYWYNQRWFDYTGTTPEEMEGWGWKRVHDPELLPSVLERWQASITAREPFEMDFPLRAADGNFRWFLTRAFPLKDGAGNVLRWCGTNTDITRIRDAEREIQRLNTNLEKRVLERTSELEAANDELEAFSYSVSHDLRAPLRAVDGFSQAVLEDFGAGLPEEGRQHLRTIRGGAQKMGALIDDLLTFSRLSRLPLKKREVNTANLVRDALRELGFSNNGRKIDMRIDEVPSCLADAALLKQVWLNLLSNALKYTRQEEAAVVEIGCMREAGNDEQVFFVRDNGTGFDMRYADKLFGVFQRLHRAEDFEGTGVGLAIVQRIVHRHGGRVWADAAVDRGATFYFTLGEEAKS